MPSGYLYGRTDADIGDIKSGIISGLRQNIDSFGTVVCSPAKRCQKTCDFILSPNQSRQTYEELWEQSFGVWDGIAVDELPDKGVMSEDELIAFASPDGESFVDLCNRVHPLLQRLCEESRGDNLTLFVHAGVIRASLALAFNNLPAALKCEIDTLSLTRLRYLGKDGFSVISLNQVHCS